MSFLDSYFKLPYAKKSIIEFFLKGYFFGVGGGKLLSKSFHLLSGSTLLTIAVWVDMTRLTLIRLAWA